MASGCSGALLPHRVIVVVFLKAPGIYPYCPRKTLLACAQGVRGSCPSFRGRLGRGCYVENIVIDCFGAPFS